MYTVIFIAFAFLFFALPLVPAIRELRRPTDGQGLDVPTGNEADAANAVSALLQPSGQLRDNLTASELEQAQAAFMQDASAQNAKHLISNEAVTVPSGLNAVTLFAPIIEVPPGVKTATRLSAATRIQIGKEVEFQMAQAPSLDIGTPTARMLSLTAPAQPQQTTRVEGATHYEGPQWWRAAGNASVTAGASVIGHIIAQGDVVIEKGAQVFGSIKAAGTVTIEESAFVAGNVLGTQIVIREAAHVKGSVVAQEKLTCNKNTVIGATDSPASLLGVQINLQAPVLVHGGITAVDSCTTY